MRSGGHLGTRDREPASARVCDAATLGFAAFTLCCHAVVAARGSFADLRWLVLCVSLLAAGTLLWLRARGRPAGSPQNAPVGSPPPRPSVALPLRAAGFVAAGLVLSIYAATGSVVALWFGSVAVLLGAALVISFAGPQPPSRGAPAARGSLEAALWALGFAAVVLAAVVHRADHDTPFYVGLAVAAVDFPDRQLMLDPIHGIAGLGLHQPAHRIHTIELFSALLASLSGTSAFFATQAFTTSLAALLVPFAFARLFRELTPRFWLGSVAVVLFVLVVAAGPNWYGNFAFVRLIHGKSVFVSVFLPLAWAYGLRFGDRPDARRFALLCAVQIAAIGCTSSALWAAPSAAGLGVLCTVRLDRRAPRVLGLALASSAYVVLVGVSLIGDMAQVAETVAVVRNPGERLADALAWTMPGERLVIFAWGSLLVAWTLRRGRAQRFAVILPLFVLLTLLNPFLEEEVQRFATGPAYRRAMWALPLPVLMTLVLTSARTILPSVRLAGPAAVAFGCLLYGLLVPGHYGLSEANRVTLGAPRLKVHPREYPPALRLARAAPPDATVLAPQGVALWLPSIHQHPRVLYARESYLQRIRETLGPEEAETRMRLSEAVSQPRIDIERRTRTSPDYERRRAMGMSGAFFREKLEHYDVRAVSLNGRAPLADRVREVLRALGFRKIGEDPPYETYARGPTVEPAP